ncbi:MAG: response regulator, partial [Acidobacteria bacterium]|nr:response regulator [Acidobacteriota bacterium]MCA1649264.1 response regulator [Acidobacteriota bacterium]
GVRAPLEKFLALHGFEVMTADTVDSALAAAAARPPDAAIVDLRLRQGSGRDVVVSIPQPIPIIIFSGVPDESSQLETLRPNTRLIQKPFSLVMLIELLQRMIAPEPRSA